MFPFQEYIKPLHEAGLEVGIGLGDVLHVGADEDQTAGAALAFGGGDAGLGAADMALESFFSEALGFEQLFFSLL